MRYWLMLSFPFALIGVMFVAGLLIKDWGSKVVTEWSSAILRGLYFSWLLLIAVLLGYAHFSLNSGSLLDAAGELLLILIMAGLIGGSAWIIVGCILMTRERQDAGLIRRGCHPFCAEISQTLKKFRAS